MQAIGNRIMQDFPDKVVIYLPTSKLVDEIINGIRKNKLNHLMEKLDQVDVLLLDDIQFIAKKDKTQEIFHNIFNDFHMKNKQIIITSDRSPKELNDIAERLKSRFSLGLIADVSQPDFETRLAILQTKAQVK
jgi:chromosomal replication initiator protein